MRLNRTATAMTTLFVVLLMTSCAKTVTPELIALNDRGVAQMGQYQYAAAYDTFAELVDKAPSWTVAKVNLAIATLNRQEPGDEERTLEMLGRVLEHEPEQLNALHVSGIVNLYLGRSHRANEFLKRVVELDPADAYAAYFLGQSYLQIEQYADAQKWLLTAIELNPNLRSAYWAAATASRRLGELERTERLIEQYQETENNPLSVNAGISYKQMGPKAEAYSSTPSDVHIATRPAGPLFADPVTIDPAVVEAVALASVDVNHDGFWDLVISTEDESRTYLGSASGLELAASVADVHAASWWGDMNNDGKTDFVRCGKTGVEVWQQEDSSRYALSLTLQSTPCSGGRLIDADHDGDLDVLLFGAGGLELYRNNLDGSYSPIGGDIGLPDNIAVRQIVVADFDVDRDLDIFLVSDSSHHRFLLNDRTWSFREAEGSNEHFGTAIEFATVLDWENDGTPDLMTVSAAGRVTRHWRSVEGWQQTDHSDDLTNSTVGEINSVDVADLDGDGIWEFLVVGSTGIASYSRTESRVVLANISGTVLGKVTYQAPGDGPRLVTVSSAGLQLWPPGSGRSRFLAIAPSGRSSSDQMRSNASGIGTHMKARVGGQWRLFTAIDSHSGGSQDLDPAIIGLVGFEKADYLELIWSDGVTQSELDLAAGLLHEIPETQRQLASCPIVFVWDGERFQFLSDVLGGAAIGFFLEPGSSVPVRPAESMLVPDGLLQPMDGVYQIKIGEPMEEVLYLDAASLVVYDLPNGVDLVLDERMNVAGNEPTGRPIFYKRETVPIDAYFGDGRDVTEDVTFRDQVAPDLGDVDRRFIGLVAKPYELTMVFEGPIDGGEPVLVVDGWMEYPYSQTVYAAQQANVKYAAPTLSARTELGEWVVVAEEFGYPAGMPRQMALPLEGLPEGTMELRLASNMEIYWDRIRVVWEEPADDIHVTRILPAQAMVRRVGFARRTTGSQRLPHYDYSDRLAHWDAKYAEGMYTQYGEATELVMATDSALAIIGSGEEIHLEFPMPTTEVPLATRRRFVIEFAGWAKDMDMYTTTGETVEPVPHLDTDLIDPGSQALNTAYNTRFESGLFPR